MTLPRAVTRAALFDFLADQLGYSSRRRFEQAYFLLTPQDRSILEHAHAGGDRSSVDWQAESAAIDSLAKGLSLLGWSNAPTASTRSTGVRERGVNDGEAQAKPSVYDAA